MWRWPMSAAQLFQPQAALPPLAVSDSEAARLLSVSVRTLYNWRQAKTGPAYCRVGNKLLYPVDGLHQWLASQTIGGHV